jgi:hypothetical protein
MVEGAAAEMPLANAALTNNSERLIPSETLAIANDAKETVAGVLKAHEDIITVTTGWQNPPSIGNVIKQTILQPPPIEKKGSSREQYASANSFTGPMENRPKCLI